MNKINSRLYIYTKLKSLGVELRCVNLIIMLSFLFTFSGFAQDHHGGNSDPNEILVPDTTMVPLPIHIGMDGSITWGIGLMDHGNMNHGGMSNGGMDHGGMDNGGMDNGGMDHGGMDNGGMDHGGMDNGGMDNGGMDNGGMDHGDMAMEEDEPASNMMHSDNGWMWAVMPMLHLGGDYYKRVISLGKNKNGKLIYDDRTSGYVAIENKSIQLGAGAMIMGMAPVSWGAFVQVGLMPYKGGHVFKMKKISNPNDTNLVDMNTPLDIKDLNNWSINDRISYSTNGGVMFSAGLGITILADMSVSYMAQGSWVTSIAKASKKHVLVSIKNSKMKMFMANIGTLISSLQIHKFNNADRNFNFLFDLTIPEAKQAYKNMIRGNITTAQQMVVSRTKGVRPVSMGKSNTAGSMRNFTSGLPFLFKSSSMYGQMQTTSYSENYMNNTKMNMEMGMYMRTRKTSGRYSAHNDTGFIFMSGAHQMSGANIKESHSVSGSFKWYFQNDRANMTYVKNRLDRAMNVLGLDTLKKIRLNKNIGALNFVRGEIDLGITDSLTRKIMKLSSDRYLYSKMLNSAKKKMDLFFSSSVNFKQICNRKNSIDRCKKKLYRRTKGAIVQIPRAIKNMKTAFLNKDKKSFVKAYSNLGMNLLENRFVFQELFSVMNEKVPSAKLRIQGTRISQTVINL